MLQRTTIEPLVIMIAFTVGALVNYKPKNRKDTARDRLPISRDESSSPRSSFSSYHSEDIDFLKSELTPNNNSRISFPNNQRFRNNLTSQILARFPFLVEIGYWLVTYWPYQLIRAYSASIINATAESRSYYDNMALNNAIRVLKVERLFGLAWEKSWQQFFLTKMPWAMESIAFVYLAHICVGISFLVYGYTFFHRASYQRVRRTIAINNWIAFVVLTLYRCAPPRLMPEEYGFIDYIHPKPPQTSSDPTKQEFDWANNTFQLKIAAMPSLHFGTACLLGFSLLKFAPASHGILRKLGMVYPPLMFLVVVTTANHWTLDCLVGLGVVVLGWHVNWVLNYLVVVEAWAYWLFRTEKPVDTKCERANGVLVI